MRLVLDSNVIIAVFATRGLCHALFEYCLENHKVIVCEEILAELFEDRVVRYRFTDHVEPTCHPNRMIIVPLSIHLSVTGVSLQILLS